MKPIYVVMIYECGRWDCCCSFGYFTNADKCREQITKLNVQEGKPLYAMNTIYKNETK